MNKTKLLSAAVLLLTALSAPAFAQGKGDGAGGAAAGGAAAGGGAAVSGPSGGAAPSGGTMTGGSAGAGLAVSGGSRGQFGGSAGAPPRGGFSGGVMKESSGNIGTSGAVRGDAGRSFAADRHDGGNWHRGHRGHGGRFFVGAGYPYYDSYAYAPGDCYLVRRKVLTRFGWRVHRVRVCD
jgi:hypothetical protein